MVSFTFLWSHSFGGIHSPVGIQWKSMSCKESKAPSQSTIPQWPYPLPPHPKPITASCTFVSQHVL